MPCAVICAAGISDVKLAALAPAVSLKSTKRLPKAGADVPNCLSVIVPAPPLLRSAVPVKRTWSLKVPLACVAESSMTKAPVLVTLPFTVTMPGE